MAKEIYERVQEGELHAPDEVSFPFLLFCVCGILFILSLFRELFPLKMCVNTLLLLAFGIN